MDREDPLARKVGSPEVVREIFEEMPIALVGIEGAEQRFSAANAAYRAFTGRSDLIGKPIREVFPEAEGQRIFELFDQVYATGKSEAIHEWRIQLDSGPGGASEELYADMTVTPRLDGDGGVSGVIVFLIDVTAPVRQRQAAQREAAEAERRYQAARDVVTELQEALLPTGLPVLPGVSVAARYLVAARDQAAGGDWFDAIPLAGGRLALVVGDIVGHGVAASAAMGQLRAVLGELLIEVGDLDVALARVDRLAARTPTLRSATMCVAILDPVTGDLQYSTCGHPPPLVVSAGAGGRYLPTTGNGPLGTGSPPVSATAQLPPDAVLLIYSDGLIERPGQPLSAGQAQLAEVAGDAAANRIMPALASASVADRVSELTVELMTRAGYDDDVTLLAVHRRPIPVEPFRRELPAEPAALPTLRAQLRGWLTAFDPTAHELKLIEMVLSELVANTVEHAYRPDRPGAIRVNAAIGADAVLELTVADDGNWKPPAPTPPDHSGRGLWISSAVLDDLRIDHPPADLATGTTVKIRHCLQHPAVLASEPTARPVRSPHMEFSATIDDGPPRTLYVAGPIDITTAGHLADRLDAASRGGVHPLVVDLTAVEILASAAVKVLFAGREHHAAHDTRLTIVAEPGSAAAQVLDLVGLDYVGPGLRPE